MTAVCFTMIMIMIIAEAVAVAVIYGIPLKAGYSHEASSAAENVLIQRIAT